MSAAPLPSGFGDYVQPFQIEAAGVRGRLVRLGPAVAAAIRPQGYPKPVASVVAEALALGAVLASGLKYDGIFTLQLHGEGPIRLVVVDMTSDGDLRAYARFEAGRLDPQSSPSDGSIPRLFGAGHMSFTVDQGPETERYQGITTLEGATLSDCAHTYFRQSEQLETAIKICATDTAPDAAAPRAAALMVQRLPPESANDADAEDDWRRSVVLMSSATPRELLAVDLSSSQLLYRLFHEDGVRVFRQRPLRHRCRCSRQRVSMTLRSFPAGELRDMADDGRIVVTCEFCRASYAFSLDQIGAESE